jgi:hypothetical protein
MKALLNMVKVTITKLIVPCSLLVALLVFLPLSLQAKVTGVCSSCHTMHNSQNGQAMATYGGTTEAQGCLLRGTCLGCHGQNSSGTQNKIPLGNVPQVLLSTSATALAGGNFKYLDIDDNRGHNVIDTGNQEDNGSMFPPPGDENTTGILKSNFTCAGKFGCHGNRTVEDKLLSLKGAHHADDSVLKFGGIDESVQGGSTGLSYRFLKGVKGGEDSEWQANSTASVHNEYKGARDRGAESTVSSPGGNTINGFCAECHGNFHGPSGGDIAYQNASPWLRHPTDIVIPNTGEYAQYNTPNTGTSQYSLTAPLARQNIPNSSSGSVTLNSDVIMCLSCHRAHASPYFKIMRWDYKSSTLSEALSGCNVCHTSKN